MQTNNNHKLHTTTESIKNKSSTGRACEAYVSGMKKFTYKLTLAFFSSPDTIPVSDYLRSSSKSNDAVTKCYPLK
jgi:hypothetical protein